MRGKGACVWKYRLIVHKDENLEFIDSYLRKYDKNYYGWSFKWQIVKKIINNTNKITFLNDAKQYCEQNFHNHSGFHYLFNLI